MPELSAPPSPDTGNGQATSAVYGLPVKPSGVPPASFLTCCHSASLNGIQPTRSDLLGFLTCHSLVTPMFLICSWTFLVSSFFSFSLSASSWSPNPVRPMPGESSLRVASPRCSNLSGWLSDLAPNSVSFQLIAASSVQGTLYFSPAL